MTRADPPVELPRRDRPDLHPEAWMFDVDDGPYFVVHFRDGSGLFTEAFHGAGARDAALRTFEDRASGWSDVWILQPMKADK